MPSSPQIFYDMSTSHLVGELRELLVEGLEFSNLGLVKKKLVSLSLTLIAYLLG